MKRRPWIWLVVLYLAVVAVNVVVVVIAQRNAPEAVPPAEGP